MSNINKKISQIDFVEEYLGVKLYPYQKLYLKTLNKLYSLLPDGHDIGYGVKVHFGRKGTYFTYKDEEGNVKVLK